MKTHLEQYILRSPNHPEYLTAAQFFRFVITGGSSVVIEIFLLFVANERIGLHYLVANAIAFVITNIYNYMVSRFWVFGEGKHRVIKEAFAFLLVVLVGLGINQMILFVAVSFIGLDLYLSKIVAILVTLLWNFTSKKFLVFNKI